MTTQMKVGDLAKQTGLTVRTLHYYDEVGLLSPSHRTEAGHRLYDDQDIIRLQQILSLRQLGFSLQDIQTCLQNPEFSLPKVIDLHRTRVRAHIAESRTLLHRLNGLARELQTTQTVAVTHLFEVMESLTMTNQYLTTAQQDTLNARFQAIAAEWQDMKTLAQDVMRDGTKLTSIKAQALAAYWQRMMHTLIAGDVDLYESLTQLYLQDSSAARSWAI